MILANGPIGAPFSGNYGAVHVNLKSKLSTFHGLAAPKKSLLGGALFLRVVKQRWNPSAQGAKRRICGALGNEEAGSGSVATRFLEKEFKFSPAFDDYVKVLESVRVERSNKGPGGEEYNSKNRLVSRGKSDRTKRQFRGAREDDGRQSASVEETNANGERAGRQGKIKELKDPAGFVMKENDGGWRMVQGFLEKGTVRKNDYTRQGKPGSNRSSSRALKNFNVERKVSDAGDRSSSRALKNFSVERKVSDAGVEKGKVNYLEKPKHVRLKDRKAVGNNKLGTSKGNNVNMDRINSRLSGKSFAPEQSKGAGGKLNKRRSLSGDIDGHKRGYIGENHSYKAAKTVRTYESNNLAERSHSIGDSIQRESEEPVISHSERRAKRFHVSNTSKKCFSSNIMKSIDEGKIHLMRDQRDREGRLRRSRRELRVEDDSDKQNIINNFVGTETNHMEHTVKQNTVSSLKIIDDKDRKRHHVGMHDNSFYTDKMHRKSNLNSSDIAGDYDLLETEDRAAFRTFEVFTDVRNRPRVLRMEMEERIDKLAKQLNAADINIPQWKFSKMIHDAKIKFTDHSILRVVQILGALGNWRRVLHIIEWFESRERFKSYKSRYIFTTVLDVLGKAKQPVEALNIFHTMRQGLSSYPDLAAYHCIAVILGQAGLMKELFDVIDCMRAAPEKKFNLGPLQRWDPRLEPDLVVYNAVLNACVQRKQWEGAFWVLEQLKQHSIKASNTTYGLVMEVMLQCGKYNLVYEFFRKVEKTSIPGALNYKVLVNALWREGKIDEAVEAVQDMERRGVVGTASLYYDLARCLCSAGRCQEALLQIKKICKVAKKPLVVTYTGLIQTCIDSGSIENAAFIFGQMHKFCLPNIITCNIMLKSYIDNGMFEEAKALFQKILDGGYQITNGGDSSQKVVADKFTFNIMIDACAQAQNWDDFESAYGQMLNHGFHFDTRKHLRAVINASKAGKVQALESTCKHLIRFDRVPPPPIIKERFCTKLMEDDLVAAISCIDIQQESHMRFFSESSWLNLLNYNAHRLKRETISRLAHELDALTAQSVEPLQAYENLSKACTQFVSQVNAIPSPQNHLEVSYSS